MTEVTYENTLLDDAALVEIDVELNADQVNTPGSSEAYFFISRQRQVAAWLVHLFTASGGICSLFAILAIHDREFIQAFWLMGVAIIIDSIDGLFAREVKVKTVTPNIDGALLDNIIDYVSYVTVPAFFLLIGDLMPYGLRGVSASIVMLTSAYQFTQHDAKTRDHFFKGFPSYWNIVVFYLFFWQTGQWTNFAILSILAALIFIPIKYVYPSRLEYLTESATLRRAMLIATLIWGVATLGLIWVYPGTSRPLVLLSSGYVVLYVAISLYRTFFPIPVADEAP